MNTLITNGCTPKTVTNDTVIKVVDSSPVEGMIMYILVKDSVDSIKLDSVINKITVDSVAYNNEINRLKKSNDSLNIQLFNANYKLNKIAEYNKIAAKGNNIKYLRGWINRTLSQ